MQKIGRNDPCLCGSGKKYKKCCLSKSAAENAVPKTKKYLSPDWDFISRNIATRSQFRQSEDFAWFVYAGLAPEDEIALGRVVVSLYAKLNGLSGAARIEALYELYEEKYTELRAQDTADGKPDFTCHAGCANCCKQSIRATVEEVDYIFDYIKQNGIEIKFDSAQLEKQVEAAYLVETRNDQAEWRKNLVAEEQNCVFLNSDSGFCKIYAARPLNCRNYFSVGSAKYCALTPTEIPADERNLKQQTNYLELAQIATAYLNISGKNNKYRNLSAAVAHKLKRH